MDRDLLSIRKSRTGVRDFIMNTATVVVLTLLVGVVVWHGFSLNESKAIEDFIGGSQPRADIGYAAEGWTEVGGYERDLRYAETFADIQGIGTATDFCRAVVRKGDPDSLMMACALGRRDGMNTLEYTSKTKGAGFRFSRDDYFKKNKNTGRMDYCRILRDEVTGRWHAVCAPAGRDGFKDVEVFDDAPPPAIRQLLEAYDGILVWGRWIDDATDYAENAVFVPHGRPVFPKELRPLMSRGLQLNRWSAASQAPPPLRDCLRWGEPETHALGQTIAPRQIRAVCFWVYWDAFEKGAKVFSASNPRGASRMWLGVEGGGVDLPPLQSGVKPASEITSAELLAVGQLTEPAPVDTPSAVPTFHGSSTPKSLGSNATYVFEIWDEEQRLMRLASPTGAARTGVWQHVAITTTDVIAWWPTWNMYVDGVLVATKTDGRLSPALELVENYVGLNMRGCLQDFRVYRKPLTEDKLRATIGWGKGKLHVTP
jgi:hypothetical protein